VAKNLGINSSALRGRALNINKATAIRPGTDISLLAGESIDILTRQLSEIMPLPQ
jgi:hypothetical protein